jgi:autotransporter-associated beta strand protein
MYWDPGNIAGTGSGGAGTWLAANAWSVGPTDSTWDNALPEIANFGGPSGGTVTLGGNVSALNGINFLTPGYTIAASATGQTLTVAGMISTSANATITSPVINAGNGSLTKTGAAALTIAGPVAINGATLYVASGNFVITTGGSVVANNVSPLIANLPGDSATLTLQGSGSFITNELLYLSNLGGTGTVNIQDSATLSAVNIVAGLGSVSSVGTGVINQNGGQVQTFFMTIAGSPNSVGTYNLNAGTLTCGSITSGGGLAAFNFNGGILRTNFSLASLFSGVLQVQIQNGGAVIDTNGFSPTITTPLADASGSTAGLTKIGAGTLTFASFSSFTGPVNVNAGVLDAAVTNGTFIATSAINVNSGGILMLGSLTGSSNVLGPGGSNSPLYINAGGTLDSVSGTTHNLGIIHLNGGVINGTSAPPTPYADFTLNSTVFADGVATVSTINAPGGINLRGNITFNVGSSSSELDVSSPIGNEVATTGGITKTGPGLMVLSGSLSFTDPSTIAAGTLKSVGHTLASSSITISPAAILEYNLSARTFQITTTLLGGGTLRVTGTSAGQLVFGGQGVVTLGFSPGALIDVQDGTLFGSSSYQVNWNNNNASLNIAPGAVFDAVEAGPTGVIQIDALNGAGTLQGGFYLNAGATSTLIIGVASGSGFFAGSLLDDAAAHLAITKVGSGTQTFTGATSYTGATTVNAGTLIVTHAFSSSSHLIISPGATFALTGGNTALTVPTMIAGAAGNWTGHLELNGNALIVETSSASKAVTLSTLLDQIAHTAGGTVGITSNAVQADPAHVTLYAYDNAVLKLTTFFGAAVDTNSLIVEETYFGDSNGDRKVDVTDLGTLATNYGKSVSGPARGDFNNDGKVDVSDLGLLATDYGLGTVVPVISLPTPEPTTLLLFAISPLLVRFRRRVSGRTFPP